MKRLMMLGLILMVSACHTVRTEMPDGTVITERTVNVEQAARVRSLVFEYIELRERIREAEHTRDMHEREQILNELRQREGELLERLGRTSD